MNLFANAPRIPSHFFPTKKLYNRYEVPTNLILNVGKNSIVCNSIFRTGEDRQGFDKDSTCNTALRVYVLKNEDLRTYKMVDEEGDPNKYFESAMKAQARVIFSGIFKYLDKISEERYTPIRLQFFADPEDDFVSYVFGFKFEKPRNVAISELRYWIGRSCINGTPFIHANNWDSHKACGAWDEAHCEMAPYFEYKIDSVRRMMPELASEVASVKQPGRTRRSTIVRKAEIEVDKTLMSIGIREERLKEAEAEFAKKMKDQGGTK